MLGGLESAQRPASAPCSDPSSTTDYAYASHSRVRIAIMSGTGRTMADELDWLVVRQYFSVSVSFATPLFRYESARRDITQHNTGLGKQHRSYTAQHSTVQGSPTDFPNTKGSRNAIVQLLH
jgi:hypothetical protein